MLLKVTKIKFWKFLDKMWLFTSVEHTQTEKFKREKKGYKTWNCTIIS